MSEGDVEENRDEDLLVGLVQKAMVWANDIGKSQRSVKVMRMMQKLGESPKTSNM